MQGGACIGERSVHSGCPWVHACSVCVLSVTVRFCTRTNVDVFDSHTEQAQYVRASVSAYLRVEVVQEQLQPSSCATKAEQKSCARRCSLRRSVHLELHDGAQRHKCHNSQNKRMT
jgi:hypothetical protein